MELRVPVNVSVRGVICMRGSENTVYVSVIRCGELFAFGEERLIVALYEPVSSAPVIVTPTVTLSPAVSAPFAGETFTQFVCGEL